MKAAFLKAIRANPEDNLPRLVYADWLEENGEPEYANFIRFSIVRQNEIAVALHPYYLRQYMYYAIHSGQIGDMRIERGFLASATLNVGRVRLKKYVPLYLNSCLEYIRPLGIQESVVHRDWTIGGGTSAGIIYDELPSINRKILKQSLYAVASANGGWICSPEGLYPYNAEYASRQCLDLLSSACIRTLKELANESG